MHTIPMHATVKVRFQSQHIGDRFYRTGWRVGTVVGQSTIGEAHTPGGVPTYDVRLRDGNVITHCSAECVRASALHR